MIEGIWEFTLVLTACAGVFGIGAGIAEAILWWQDQQEGMDDDRD